MPTRDLEAQLQTTCVTDAMVETAAPRSTATVTVTAMDFGAVGKLRVRERGRLWAEISGGLPETAPHATEHRDAHRTGP